MTDRKRDDTKPSDADGECKGGPQPGAGAFTGGGGLSPGKGDRPAGPDTDRH